MKIGNCEIKNRIVMSPMLMGFGRFDGCVTEQLMDYYEERAKGGTGLIITEITRINDFHGSAAFAQLAMIIKSRDFMNLPSVSTNTAQNFSCSCTIPVAKTSALQSAPCRCASR